MTLISRTKSRLASHYREVYERDKRWIMQFNLSTLNKFLWPMFVAYICLNFLDVYQTTLAMNFGPLFHEENPLAAALFDRQFQGFLVALAFKYLPVIPLFYAAFAQDEKGMHAVGIRVVKVATLVALGGADLLLFYVVGVHNLQSLLMIS